MPANYTELEKSLWDAADQLRANSKLKPSEYSVPVLGLIFLRYADYKFFLVKKELEKEQAKKTTKRRRKIGGVGEYQAKGALYLPEEAWFNNLLDLPESENIGQKLVEAMKAIASKNTELSGVLPTDYVKLEKSVLIELLKVFNRIDIAKIGEDAFGEIYQYFLGNFAQKEGQKGGEFFTPISVVKLIVEIIEPDNGLILDPACGAGGMFVQSALFTQRRTALPNAAFIRHLP